MRSSAGVLRDELQSGSAARENAELAYLLFICISAACRSIEQGVVSSMAADIQASFDIDFTKEGLIAGSPDYGMILGALLAGMVLKRGGACGVLQASYFMIATSTFAFILCPTFRSMSLSRCISGFLWAFAAVHYPAWINCHGPPDRRTKMLALPSVMMLLGTVIGYLAGGVANDYSLATWLHVYGLTGILMIFCAFASLFLDSTVVNENEMQAVDGKRDSERQPLFQKSELTTEHSMWGLGYLVSIFPIEVRTLMSCRLFLFVIMVITCISGTGSFILYFIAQFGQVATTWSEESFNLITSSVMVVASITGAIGGAECLSRIGGYQNYDGAIKFIICCSFGCLLSSAFLAVGVMGGSSPVDVAAFFGIILFAAAPTAAINGILVSVVPGASRYASGLLCAFVHSAKVVIPVAGGHIIDNIGLLSGFCIVITSTTVLMLTFCVLAFIEHTYFHNSSLSKGGLH